MKQIGAWRLAFVYAGCFLGAGYVSGQEILHFFGVFGVWGMVGVCISALLQGSFCLILLTLIRHGGVTDVGRVMVRGEHRRWRAVLGGAQLGLLFGVTVIMAAGVGALVDQMLSRFGAAASLVFCALLAVVALLGVEGMVAVFSAAVPMLASAVLLLTVASLWQNGIRLPMPTVAAASPLLPHWTVSAVLFVSYNMFGSVAVLLPVARQVTSDGAARRGVAIGTVSLLLAALCILLSLASVPGTETAELPMLSLAMTLHPAAGWCFALLLLFAMFGTALSCTVAAREYLAVRWPAAVRRPAVVVLLWSAAAFLSGRLGFGELIGWIYPAFGYLGCGMLISVTLHARHLRRGE